MILIDVHVFGPGCSDAWGSTGRHQRPARIAGPGPVEVRHAGRPLPKSGQTGSGLRGTGAGLRPSAGREEWGMVPFLDLRTLFPTRRGPP